MEFRIPTVIVTGSYGPVITNSSDYDGDTQTHWGSQEVEEAIDYYSSRDPVEHGHRLAVKYALVREHKAQDTLNEAQATVRALSGLYNEANDRRKNLAWSNRELVKTQARMDAAIVASAGVTTVFLRARRNANLVTYIGRERARHLSVLNNTRALALVDITDEASVDSRNAEAALAVTQADLQHIEAISARSNAEDALTKYLNEATP